MFLKDKVNIAATMEEVKEYPALFHVAQKPNPEFY